MDEPEKNSSDSARFYIKKKVVPRRLGDILLSTGYITSSHLKEALQAQEKSARRMTLEELLAIELFKEKKYFPAVLPSNILIRNILHEHDFMPVSDVDALVQELQNSYSDRENLIDIILDRKLLSEDQIKRIYKIQGEAMFTHNIISLDNLRHATAAWKTSKKTKPIGKILIDMGFITEDKYVAALAKYARLPFIDLKKITLGPELAKILPQELVQYYRILPVRDEGPFVTVAVAFPLDYKGLEVVIDSIGRYVNRMLCKDSDFEKACRKIYGRRMKWR